MPTAAKVDFFQSVRRGLHALTFSGLPKISAETDTTHTYTPMLDAFLRCGHLAHFWHALLLSPMPQRSHATEPEKKSQILRQQSARLPPPPPQRTKSEAPRSQHTSKLCIPITCTLSHTQTHAYTHILSNIYDIPAHQPTPSYCRPTHERKLNTLRWFLRWAAATAARCDAGGGVYHHCSNAAGTEVGWASARARARSDADLEFKFLLCKHTMRLRVRLCGCGLRVVTVTTTTTTSKRREGGE